MPVVRSGCSSGTPASRPAPDLGGVERRGHRSMTGDGSRLISATWPLGDAVRQGCRILSCWGRRFR
jgi:hypothetical protein